MSFPAPPLGPRTWLAWPLLGVAWLLARLPWALQRSVGRGLGACLHVLLVGRRQVALRNVELCFPELDERARRDLVRAAFRELGIGLFEFVRAWWGTLGELEEHSAFEGLEHLRAAQEGGRGVILLSGHFVTLEMCGRLLCRHAPVAGMYRPHGQALLEWAVKRGRLRYASMMFSREELRPALRHLKGGGILWFAPDQETRRGDSVFVPFFGHAAWSLTSTHQLARLSGAAVLPFFHRRRTDGQGYDIRLGPALEGFPTADAVADTARVMQLVEAMVREAPAQYLWIHKRFKRRPEGAAPAYTGQ